MRTSQLSLCALIGSAFAIPVQVEELDKRVMVIESKVVWTTTTSWSTQIVWETGAPSSSGVEAAGFEGDQKPQSYAAPSHKVHTPTFIPSTAKAPTPTSVYTPPVSTPAAPVPETTTSSSSSTPPPPPPPSSTPSSTSVYVAPTPTTTPTSTYVPPPPTTTSTPAPPPPAPTTSSVYVAPTVSAAAAPSPSTYSGSSSSSGSSSTGAGTSSSPFTGQGTFYALGLGSCGVTSKEGQMVVAVGAGYMAPLDHGNPNTNPTCGKTITIMYQGVTATATVVDKCPGCAGKYDLDMSEALFDKFAKSSQGRIFGLEWYFN